MTAKEKNSFPGGRAGRKLASTANRAWSYVSGLLPFSDEKLDPVLETTVALIKTELLSDDGRLDDDEIEAFRAIFGRQYPSHKVQELVRHLKDCDPVTPEEAAKVLRGLPQESQLAVLRMLFELANARDERSEAQDTMVRHLADLLDIPAELLEEADRTAGDNAKRHQLLKSGAGILVALVVIVLFIVTATVLKSVVFGLILAYIFLPVERFYEGCLTRKRNPFYWLFRLVDLVLSPLPRLARRLAGRGGGGEIPEPLRQEKERLQRTARATTLTVITAVVIGIFLLVFVSSLSAGYVVRLGDSVNALVYHPADAVDAAVTPVVTQLPALPGLPLPAAGIADAVSEAAVLATEPEAPPPEGIDRVISWINSELEHLKVKFENLPPVQWALQEITKFMARDDAADVILNFVARKTVGFFSFTAEFFSWLGALLVDLLLTVFFFSLFLNKIATASRKSEGDRDSKYSRYLVRTVFNGKWLPKARENTLNEAERIIEQVIIKLRTWLRGSLIMMVIDAVVFTAVFYFLGIPYFALFGLLAGLSVFLPYIGPIVTACLTVLVTLAVGGPSVSALQVFGIIGIYLWQNGVVDQFFLYPLVVGDALGLSAMETIIVLLLGGILAGITGMIFAMPAAAVIKYLVPQIYSRLK